MKTSLRIAAVLSFLFPFVFGVALLLMGITSDYKDGLMIGAIGSFLIGDAIFVGAILLFAAEKLNRSEARK